MVGKAILRIDFSDDNLTVADFSAFLYSVKVLYAFFNAKQEGYFSRLKIGAPNDVTDEQYVNFVNGDKQIYEKTFEYVKENFLPDGLYPSKLFREPFPDNKNIYINKISFQSPGFLEISAGISLILLTIGLVLSGGTISGEMSDKKVSIKVDIKSMIDKLKELGILKSKK